MALHPDVVKLLGVTAQVFGKDLSEAPEVFAIYKSELEPFPPAGVSAALRRCIRELRTFPALADIISRIEDTRPGAEEAWVMLPQSEAESVVWTDEMREAHAIVAGEMASDAVAARMAFREAYTRIVAQARAERRPARWNISLGHDPVQREAVVHEAIRKNRITAREAMAVLPDFSPDSKTPLLTSPKVDPIRDANLDRIRLVLSLIKSTPTEKPEDSDGVRGTRERAKQAIAELKKLEAGHD